MQFNKYSLYSISTEMKLETKPDFVDECRTELVQMNEYTHVKEYLTSKFGDLIGEHWFEYPDLHKEVYISIDDEKVEFCALKNEKQYFGKGWRLISKTN